jgi:ribosomal protein S18 acetylase RimI-like enzyme
VSAAVLEVRDAREDELDDAGLVTQRAYTDDGLVGPDYALVLRDAASRARQARLLVAVLDGRVVGTVTFALGGTPYAERSVPGESEIRMLGTTSAARGQGVGTALTRRCVELAREAGCSAVRLSSQPEMRAAHRIYERMGFLRTPERDWTPVPGVDLLTYVLTLAYCGRCGEPGRHEACDRQLLLEPPRYCGQCRRRMVVQVHPTGWTARCVEHGLLAS